MGNLCLSASEQASHEDHGLEHRQGEENKAQAEQKTEVPRFVKFEHSILHHLVPHYSSYARVTPRARQSLRQNKSLKAQNTRALRSTPDNPSANAGV
jgi:hypothetical protein